MRLWGVLAVAVVCSLAASPCLAAPLAAYGKLPSIEQAAISPDGALLAVALTDGEARTVVILNSGDDKPVVALHAGTSKIRDLTWAGSSHLLITGSVTGQINDVIAPTSEWYLVIDYDLKTDRQRNVLDFTEDTLNAVTAFPTVRVVNGKPFAYVEANHFVHDQGQIALYQADLDRGRTELLADGEANTEDWLVDEAGRPFAQTRYSAQSGKWSLLVKRSGDWKEAEAVDTSYGFDGELGLGRDGRSVVVSADKDGKDALREYHADSGSWGDVFSVEDNVEAIYDPVTGVLIGSHALVGDHDDYKFYSPADQANWDAAAKAFAGQRVTLQNMSADHKKLVVLVDAPLDGAGYALVDVGTGKASYIGTVYDGVFSQDVSQVRPVAYKAADGLAITGYLTLPHGKDPKNLPLVVFPHGGPAARDEPGFDWWAQAMASRGYAVLQVNYRGSDGFGWDFLSAGFGEWGRKMQTDLSDGVRSLAAQGTIDPKRVCIVGASYGGYAALAGATLDPGVYRCAVSVAGIADVKRFVAWDKDRTDVSAERYWDRYVGAKSLADPRLADISPADHVDAKTVPILLIHGKDDTVVPFEQSDLMAAALAKAGHPTDIVVLKHEDHWLSHGDTRLQMLQATVDFLEKYNPPN